MDDKILQPKFNIVLVTVTLKNHSFVTVAKTQPFALGQTEYGS